ncbi:hypothetical protein B7R54_18225 [Subtercola boreus]|uniref:Methyltransferase type 11 domain-containing protein n=1 Tax=Subtercola boreus TaxID=120213 RepID=A0A3E0VNA1_9MICO|nr:class I SAM-dependent methyltransferase [Subtercola boreus]RFA10928.1 hypothetical protein B7R54_18225 [Subtercola boreus]TQL55478.1 methyltransferase family protein [Subtercola boreus]
MTRDTEHALSFGRAVGAYELGRPSYPAEAIDWILAELAPADPDARTFVDVGAGTGKFTASLLGHGARVVAVEPDETMRGTLGEKFPAVETFGGTAERLPLEDDSADLVTFAQAWHWVDVPAASAEAARVLKPGGTLALVWNIRDESVDWVSRLTGIIEPSAAEQYDSVTPPVSKPLTTVSHADFFWDNPLRREQLLAMVTSRSYIIALAPDARAEVVRAVEQLLDEHPDLSGHDSYTMPYVTRVTLARAT